MILVAGATGSLGFEICRLLAEDRSQVRALVRPTAPPAKIEKLRALGVALAEGDVRSQESVAAACREVNAVVSTVATTLSHRPGDSLEEVDLAGTRNLIDAAVSAGAKRFLYVSFSGTSNTGPTPLTEVKRSVEAYLRRGPLAHTILRPTFFMETFLGPSLGFHARERRAKIYGSGQRPVSWIAIEDVARFAAKTIGSPSAENVTLELGGPEALSPLAVVDIYEALAGAPFELETVSEQELIEQAEEARDPYVKSYLGLTLALARGDAIEMTSIRATYPFRMRTVREYAELALSAGGERTQR
jgi:uncharacterized protein YbjT (DUF2867 family)